LVSPIVKADATMNTERFIYDSSNRPNPALAAGAVDAAVCRPGSYRSQPFQAPATHERQQGRNLSHIIVKPRGIEQ
jgi:hypothetical protein